MAKRSKEKRAVDELMEFLTGKGEKTPKPRNLSTSEAREDFALPKKHMPVVRVPKGTGGAVCSNCEYLSSDKKRCGASWYKKFMKTDLLLYPHDEQCSDWWNPSKSRK